MSYNYKKHWEGSNYGGGAEHTWDEFILSLLVPGSVLDVGCGAGRFVETLSKDRGYMGVDISSLAIQDIKKRYPELPFEKRDIVEWSGNGRKWDNVFSWTVLEHIPHEHIEQVIDNLSKMADNLVICEPVPDGAEWAEHCFPHHYEDLLDIRRRIDMGSVFLHQCRSKYAPPEEDE